MPEPVSKPQDYAKVEAFAWAIVLGETIAGASKFAEISDNTARNWLASDWWQEEWQAARARIPSHMAARALNGLIRAMNDPLHYASACKWVAERVIDGLGPPSRKDEPQRKLEPGFSMESEGAIRKFLGVGDLPDTEEDE